ncbi:MAG: sulfatase-like hydrolase/transferase [Kiritimatiellae bacterium]|nr:sulfatase-like hydrolase/transferase [Kiritimatiellia bacterium]
MWGSWSRAPALLAAAMLTARALAAGTARPVNVVIVLADDLGWGDLAGFGNDVVATPNLDRLAAEGRRFRHFYANSPVCSPTRCAILTGQYPQRWRITSYLDSRENNRRRGVADWLDPAAPSLARFFRAAGYATGHFGKWHLGGQRDVGDAPSISAYGFDESLTNFEGLGPRLLGLCDTADGRPPRPHALGSDRLGRGPVIWYDRASLTAGYVGAAVAFISRAAAEGRPFYVHVWPDDPHGPWYPPRERRGDGSKRALYRGVVETMDEQLGPLFERLREPDLRDQTVLLFFSDNGPEPGAGSAVPLRGSKATLYEGGIRSPLIVWAPGLMPAAAVGGRDEESVICTADLAPSLLRIAGIAPPTEVVFDGLDMSEALLGRRSMPRSEPICWQRPPDRKYVDGRTPPPLPDLAIRHGRWKLLCEQDGSSAQLYDLVADPGETTNLAALHPDLVLQLSQLVRAWSAEIGDGGNSSGSGMRPARLRHELMASRVDPPASVDLAECGEKPPAIGPSTVLLRTDAR